MALSLNLGENNTVFLQRKSKNFMLIEFLGEEFSWGEDTCKLSLLLREKSSENGCPFEWMTTIALWVKVIVILFLKTVFR